MTLLEQNRAVLEVRFPGMLAELGGDPCPLEELPQWQLSRSGAVTARWAGKSLASTFDPVADALRGVPRIADSVDFVVAAGLGLGYGIEALVATIADIPVLVAEPSAWWFCRVLEQRDLTSLLANPLVSFVVGAPASHVGAYLERFHCKTIERVFFRPARDLFAAWFADLDRALDEFQAQARVNSATLERFSPMWLANLSRNELWSGQQPEPEFHAVAPLEGLLKGGRVVIAAAGPSLSQSLDWLVAHRREFLLVAVDTSWQTLCSRGLVADVLVVMDGQYWNARHVDPPVVTPTVIVAEWVSHPMTLRLAPERLYLAATSVPFLEARERRRWGDLGSLKSGGSVATVAWELALFLGASEVVFAGLDLGYPPGGSHVRGSQFEQRHHRQSSRIRPAESQSLAWLAQGGLTLRESVTGALVPSDPRMDLYRRWLEGGFAAHPEVQVWNLSSTGSRIQGARAPVPGWDTWPTQAVPEWPGAKLVPKAVPQGAELDPPSLEFPQTLTEHWVSQWEDGAKRLWGTRGWQMIGAKALDTWRVFPTPRSAAAVRQAWEVEQLWKTAIFRSRMDGPIR